MQHSHDAAAAEYHVWRVLIGRLISHPDLSRAHMARLMAHGDVLAKNRAMQSTRSPNPISTADGGAESLVKA